MERERESKGALEERERQEKKELEREGERVRGGGKRGKESKGRWKE